MLDLGDEAVVLTCHHVMAELSPEAVRVAVPDRDGELGSPQVASYDEAHSSPERDAVLLRIGSIAPRDRPLLHGLEPAAYEGNLPKRATGYTHMPTQTFDARVATPTRVELDAPPTREWPGAPHRYLVPHAFRLADPTDAREGVSGAVVAYEGGVLGLAHFARAASPSHERELYLVPLSVWAERFEAMSPLIEPLLDQQLRDAALVRRVRDLTVGIGYSGGDEDPDIVIAGYRPDVYAARPQLAAAEEALRRGRGLLVVGRPKSGKTRLVWECLRRDPDAIVVMPGDAYPPAEFERAGLAGRDVVVLCDDLHAVAENLHPLRWRDRLAETAASVTVIATVRDGQEWTRVRDNQVSLLAALPEVDRVFLSRVGETGADLPVELARKIAAEIGMAENELAERFDGTPGSLTLDLGEMRARYERLREQEVAGVAASRLLDSLKLLHEGGQTPLVESLARKVAAEIRGNGALANETWETICRRTQSEGFGTFVGGEFRTYRPYLEECVRYVPAGDEIDCLLEILRSEAQWFSLVSLAVARTRRGETGRAIEILRDVIRDSPGSEARVATFTLGHVLLGAGDYVGAEEVWRKAEALGVFEATLNVGVAAERRGDLAVAEDAYRRAEERGDSAASHNLGNVLQQRGDLEGAVAAFRRGERHGDTSASYGLGLVLEHRGDLDGAAAAYRRAGFREGLYNLGVAFKERGDLEAAYRAWEEADTLGDGRAATAIGNLHGERGELHLAERAWRRGAERGEPAAAYGLGRLFLMRRDRTQALAALAWAAERHHDAAAGLLGYVLGAPEDFDLAYADEAWRASGIEGQRHATYNLGLFYESRGDLDAAAAVFSKGAEEGDADAAFALAHLLHRHSQLEDAEVAYAHAERLGHRSAAANLSALLGAKGRAEEAEAAARRGFEQGDFGAAYNLGLQLAQRGDKDGARAALRNAATSKDPELAKLATGALERLEGDG